MFKLSCNVFLMFFTVHELRKELIRQSCDVISEGGPGMGLHRSTLSLQSWCMSTCSRFSDISALFSCPIPMVLVIYSFQVLFGGSQSGALVEKNTS